MRLRSFLPHPPLITRPQAELQALQQAHAQDKQELVQAAKELHTCQGDLTAAQVRLAAGVAGRKHCVRQSSVHAVPGGG